MQHCILLLGMFFLYLDFEKKIMKKIIFTLSLLMMGLFLQGQDISKVFMDAPDSVLFGLDLTAREKLLNTPSDTARVIVENDLGGEAQRLAISDDYLWLKTSQAGAMEIKLLPLVNNTKIIAVIYTVCKSVCDSQICFFTTDWQALEQANILPSIAKNAFLKNGIDSSDNDFVNASKALVMNPVKLSFSAKDMTLKMQSQIKEYLPADDFKLIEPYLGNQTKTLSWDRSSFK